MNHGRAILKGIKLQSEVVKSVEMHGKKFYAFKSDWKV
jgi:hypothetical protein